MRKTVLYPFTIASSGKCNNLKNNHSPKPVLPVKCNLRVEKYKK